MFFLSYSNSKDLTFKPCTFQMHKPSLVTAVIFFAVYQQPAWFEAKIRQLWKIGSWLDGLWFLAILLTKHQPKLPNVAKIELCQMSKQPLNLRLGSSIYCSPLVLESVFSSHSPWLLGCRGTSSCNIAVEEHHVSCLSEGYGSALQMFSSDTTQEGRSAIGCRIRLAPGSICFCGPEMFLHMPKKLREKLHVNVQM